MKVLNSAEYFLPQSRRRVFMVGVRSDVEATSKASEDWVKNVTSLEFGTLPMPAFLCGDDSEVVRDELQRRQKLQVCFCIFDSHGL